MGTPALVRNRTRLVWAALPFLLTQASAYEAGPSSLSVLEASLVKLKKESAQLHEHGTALKEVKPLKSGAVHAGTESNIAQVRSVEAKLSTENHRLRQQLQRTSPKSEVSLLASSEAQGDHSFALLVRLLLLFVVVNSVLYLLWNMEGPTVEKVKRRAAEPLMRAMGRGTYEVEISELQVTNLPLTGSVVLGFELCGRRQAAEALCEQGLVRFQDRFRFQIQGGGSEGQSCVLRVTQAEETLAEVALSTKDILRRVHSKHGQQYFHYRMFPKEAYASWRPSLSLRMREVERTRR